MFSTILTGAIAIIPARAEDCSNEKALKSLPSSAASELLFQNKSADKRRIYWVDQEGDRKFYGIVEPGNAFKQPTFAGHAWVVTDEAEKCLYSFVATAEPRTVAVGEVAASVTAPPPGGQQPIVQAQPQVVAPPVVVQAAPQAVQAAPPPVQAAPPPVAAQLPSAAPPAADPAALADTQMTDLPQVSPVEQFQLNGAYRLVTRLDNTKVLNNEASGTLDVMAVQPQWDSAQWTFEAVPGTPFVRIRNLWKKTYLADVSGKPRAVPAPPEATESHWTFEPVDGTSFVQFRNRETDRFLLSVNGAAVLVDDFRQDMESNSHWRNAPVSGGSAAVAAVNPPRPLYDDALASCRGIGGYWTGSSCRRPVYLTEPLACPRGFVWAEETGECLWDGGRCPPWQVGPGGVCGTNLVCRGGAVAPGPRGYPACYCPPGAVAWGNYPNLACVPSVARVAPYLLPVVAAGVVAGIINGGKGRPQIGTVFGNSKACPTGQTGTPPNCTAASACPPGFVQGGPYCVRQGTVKQPVVPVVGTKPTVAPQTLPVVAPNTTPTNPVCGLGQTLQNGVCVNLNQAITCTGGNIAQGVCGCPQGTRLTGSGTNFQCVAATVTTPTTPNPICNLGERLVDGKCVNLNAAITCTGGTIAQGVCGCPQGTRLTGGGNNFQCVAATTPNPLIGGTATVNPTTRVCTVGEVPQAANCECKDPHFVFDGKCAEQTLAKPTTPTQTTPICNIGERPVDGKCVNINAAITCTGGTVAQGVCGCPQGTRLTGSGNNFQCVAGTATGGGTTTTPPVATLTCTGGTINQGNCQCPLGANQKGTYPNFECVATGQSAGSCKGGRLVQGHVCVCPDNTVSLRDSDGAVYCEAKQVNQNRPSCKDGQNSLAAGCRCDPPMKTDESNLVCRTPRQAGAACKEGDNIKATACSCNAPLKQIENGVCGRLLLNETKPVSAGGTCSEGADIKATGCTCTMKTVDAGGGKFVCRADTAAGPPVCTEGQNTASGCRCAAPLTVLPAGVCGKPTARGAACLEGQNIAATGCVCSPPLKQIENGYCGRLLLNETKPLAKGGACGEGADIKATGCVCNMKTVDAGGGKFICSANAQKPGGALAPAAKCPDGMTGTPPNCVSPKVDRAPATCPAGMTGTPPNCVKAPPATCPAGMTGTPPNCVKAPPATCPAGMTGTPPNCVKPPPATCPAGMTGTPPNCVRPPPATCPQGMTGTPPNCVRPPPATCPQGMTGTPPNCVRPAPATCPQGMTGTPPNCVRPAVQQQPIQQPRPTGGPPACAPPKRLLPNGQCV